MPAVKVGVFGAGGSGTGAGGGVGVGVGVGVGDALGVVVPDACAGANVGPPTTAVAASAATQLRTARDVSERDVSLSHLIGFLSARSRCHFRPMSNFNY